MDVKKISLLGNKMNELLREHFSKISIEGDDVWYSYVNNNKETKKTKIGMLILDEEGNLFLKIYNDILPSIHAQMMKPGRCLSSDLSCLKRIARELEIKGDFLTLIH